MEINKNPKARAPKNHLADMISLILIGALYVIKPLAQAAI
jgi:hypothetical protein